MSGNTLTPVESPKPVDVTPQRFGDTMMPVIASDKVLPVNLDKIWEVQIPLLPGGKGEGVLPPKSELAPIYKDLGTNPDTVMLGRPEAPEGVNPSAPETKSEKPSLKQRALRIVTSAYERIPGLQRTRENYLLAGVAAADVALAAAVLVGSPMMRAPEQGTELAAPTTPAAEAFPLDGEKIAGPDEGIGHIEVRPTADGGHSVELVSHTPPAPAEAVVQPEPEEMAPTTTTTMMPPATTTTEQEAPVQETPPTTEVPAPVDEIPDDPEPEPEPEPEEPPVEPPDTTLPPEEPEPTTTTIIEGSTQT